MFTLFSYEQNLNFFGRNDLYTMLLCQNAYLWAYNKFKSEPRICQNEGKRSTRPFNCRHYYFQY